MIRYIKGNFKYCLTETHSFITEIVPDEPVYTYFIDLVPDESMQFSICTIRKGYGWDGPSGPTIDTDDFIRPSLEHDVKYELLRKELIDKKWREIADIELRVSCLDNNMSEFRANYVYEGVKHFGRSHADPKNRKKELTAP